MFTGIIREVGKIRALARQGELTRLELSAPRCVDDLDIGDSLAVNGICLTVTRKRGGVVRVEAASETRRVTTLKRWRAGDRVHLEPALRAGDALGGHLVLGHVDGLGTVRKIQRSSRSWFLTVSLAPELARYLMPKGSVAVDGVSLTVDAGPFRREFTVNVIPHTLASTRFRSLRIGDTVNLEMDVLVKAARGGHAAVPGILSRGQLPAETASDDLNETSPRTLASLWQKGFRRRAQGDGGTGK
ncbi:MAG: riboflavin synthase [bacterium]